MARTLILILVLGSPTLSHAGSLYDAFQAGVLGIPWGSSLDNLVGAFPDGDHVFAVTPGHRGYWVKDGQLFLGVPRERNGVLFGLDKNDRVGVAAVAFPYERSVELKNVLISMFGVPVTTTTTKETITYGWRPDSGIAASVTEFGQGHQKMIWLSVTGPNYIRQPACQCSTR